MGQRFNRRPSRSRDGTFMEMNPCEAVRKIQILTYSIVSYGLSDRVAQ